MRELGRIVRLQIQRSPLKTGEKQHKEYDPAPILALERLRMGPEGAIALVEGRDVLDVHHRHHLAIMDDLVVAARKPPRLRSEVA